MNTPAHESLPPTREEAFAMTMAQFVERTMYGTHVRRVFLASYVRWDVELMKRRHRVGSMLVSEFASHPMPLEHLRSMHGMSEFSIGLLAEAFARIGVDCYREVLAGTR